MSRGRSPSCGADTDADDAFGFDTLAVRAGQVRTGEGEHNDPVFVTSSFVFASAREAAARFADEEKGNVYSRFTNPTVRTFEERLAALEGGRFAIGTASGMSAILATCLALLEAGSHVVAARDLFGSTVSLFTKVLRRFGIETTFVPLTDMAAWRQAIRPDTRMLFLETPSNPLCEIADMRRLAELAGEHGCKLIIDNCMCTPALQRPFEYGADVVIHSATKYLDGQGRCIGGAIVVRDEALRDEIFAVLRTAGPSMSPFNAWVFLKGLETLRLRMEAHSAAALELARWLSTHARVERVYYPGLESHPQHLLARSQQRAFGGIVSFEVAGGRAAAWRVIDATRMMSITANLGDAKTTITHPATTTHARITAEERARAGIGENLLRVSVGLENLADIKVDLERGLARLNEPLAAGAGAART